MNTKFARTHLRHAHRRKTALIGAAAVASLALAGTGIASATFGGTDSAGQIHGCFNLSTGALRVIDPSTSSCTNKEQALVWNQKGPQGPTGATGPTGPAGMQGPTGPVGAAGAQGPAGAPGPAGATGAAGASGPAAWSTIAPWNSTANYVAGPPADIVTYNGGAYVAVHANRGDQPDNGSGNWVQVAAAGTQGPQGIPGPQGLTGSDGPQGDTGPAGLPGATGATGPAGSAGPTGPQGPAGPSDMYANGSPSDTLTASGTTVASMSVPAGIYELNFNATAVNPSTTNSAEVWCFLNLTGNVVQGAVTLPPAANVGLSDSNGKPVYKSDEAVGIDYAITVNATTTVAVNCDGITQDAANIPTLQHVTWHALKIGSWHGQ